MKLSGLIKAANPLSVDYNGSGKKDPEIRSIHYRSQDVKPGGLFVAIAGHAADGHDYIEDAIARGAVAVVSQKKIKAKVPTVRVPDTRQVLADIAAKRIQDDELIWMEACPQLVPLGESSALLETPYDFIAIGKIANLVPAFWMCLEWKNLAVYPKATDPVVGAELK